jgi:hypothetical protein
MSYSPMPELEATSCSGRVDHLQDLCMVLCVQLRDNKNQDHERLIRLLDQMQ